MTLSQFPQALRNLDHPALVHAPAKPKARALRRHMDAGSDLGHSDPLPDAEGVLPGRSAAASTTACIEPRPSQYRLAASSPTGRRASSRTEPLRHHPRPRTPPPRQPGGSSSLPHFKRRPSMRPAGGCRADRTNRTRGSWRANAPPTTCATCSTCACVSRVVARVVCCRLRQGLHAMLCNGPGLRVCAVRQGARSIGRRVATDELALGHSRTRIRK